MVSRSVGTALLLVVAVLGVLVLAETRRRERADDLPLDLPDTAAELDQEAADVHQDAGDGTSAETAPPRQTTERARARRPAPPAARPTPEPAE